MHACMHVGHMQLSLTPCVACTLLHTYTDGWAATHSPKHAAHHPTGTLDTTRSPCKSACTSCCRRGKCPAANMPTITAAWDSAAGNTTCGPSSTLLPCTCFLFVVRAYVLIDSRDLTATQMSAITYANRQQPAVAQAAHHVRRHTTPMYQNPGADHGCQQQTTALP